MALAGIAPQVDAGPDKRSCVVNEHEHHQEHEEHAGEHEEHGGEPGGFEHHEEHHEEHRQPDEAGASGAGEGAPTEETFEVKGENLLAKIKELVREGNIRRIIIKTEQGETFIEIPLTVGVVGAVLLPVWAAIGAIAALVTNCTITVERRESGSDDD
jgi:hypothetical protein